MNEEVWLEILKNQGIATVLILVACAVLWFWVMPEWRRNEREKLELEKKRQQAEVDLRESLREELRETRSEHRNERASITHAHREDIQAQYKLFDGMVASICVSLEKQRLEIAKNSALTVASAQSMGASRKEITEKASLLFGADIDDEEVLL